MSNKSKKKVPSQQKQKQAKLAGKKEVAASIPKWAIAAVLVFTALLYAKALYNGFAGWDDDGYILQNPFIKDFSLNGVKAIFSSFYFSNYHPLTTLTYLFEYTWYGLNPLPYHLLNILLHLLNTWLVFKLVEQLSGKKITALLVSILFAVHPMHVESVAWISERKDVMYSLFYLLSLLAYLRYLKLSVSASKTGKRVKYYVATLLLFVASLLSKPAAVTLPVLLIALDMYKGRKINAKSLLEKVPFFILSLIFGILTILSQQVTESINDVSLSYSFIERIFLFTYAIAFYIVKLVAPFGLSAMHYFPVIHEGLLPWQYYASLPFILFVAWLLLKCTSHTYRHAGFRKEIIFGVFFFLVSISVMLQIVTVGSALTSERYTYVPYIGLFYIVALWISDIQKKQVRNSIIALFSLFVIMFSYQTYDRISVWKNGDILFTDVIKKNPNFCHGYWIRGNLKKDKGDLQGALQDYNKTLEYKPEFAEAYNNRGSVYDGLGNTKAAILDYNKAILLNPKLAIAYNNRGVFKIKTGDINGAMKDINMAMALIPSDAKTYSNRGYAKLVEKDYKGSFEDYSYSIKLNPDDKEVYYNRGVARLSQKDTTGACEDWKKAMEMGLKDEVALQTIRQHCNPL